MFRLPDKHPVFNRAVLWPILLGSTALFVPLVLAKSIPPQPQPITASSEPSPQSPPSPEQSKDKLLALAEREWQHRLVSQGLTWPQSSNTNTSTTTSKTSTSKTDTSPSKSAVAKTNTPQASKSKTTAQTQASEPSKTSKQQPSKSQGSTTGKQDVPHHAHTGPTLEMRVAIANGDSSLVVGASTSAEVVDAQGKGLGKLPANEGTNVLPNGQSLRLGKWETPAGVWIKPTKGGLIFVNDRWYRGDLLLVTQGNSLLAVNYVELEDYIASVVGAEVSPSWPMDALKAQAIAARSYAIVHYIRPASSLYDLGNTERWQVYRGITAEWNTTRQAVHETSGVFLSYKGGVVESLYAASDDIVVNVFGGRGMSQNGALSLAQKGYNYQQILGNYYPGTSLAWLDTKKSDAD
ncbi:MAG TPA: SpoIID/LytB domain-containing protein [Coleofasciculaceae cyanobacterium]